MKHIDEVEYSDVGNPYVHVECPECGSEVELWEDETGWGYRCNDVTCLSFDALGGE